MKKGRKCFLNLQDNFYIHHYLDQLIVSLLKDLFFRLKAQGEKFSHTTRNDHFWEIFIMLTKLLGNCSFAGLQMNL